MAQPDVQVQRTYLTLTLFTTLAASFIWGINTLFLLSAGLDNTQAFAVNAFFTVGQVLFEVPTGVVADTRGRRFSFLLGTATLMLATLLYLVMWEVRAGLLGWAISSILLGLGFTFFSGATEAWLVDALKATGYRGTLERIFARAQIVTGVAMLTGSVLGGVVAQLYGLGVPYVLRAVLLGVTFLIAFRFMRDIGFTPARGASVGAEIGAVLRGSVDGGLRNPPVRWLMLSAPFTAGVGIFAFYALQPYLLQLYGDPTAYGIAGLAAAIVAAAQITGGLIVPRVRRLFRRRTDAPAGRGRRDRRAAGRDRAVEPFLVVLVLIVAWALIFAIEGPLRQAYLNGIIPSEQRATVLSFDNLMGSAGGVVFQPILGRVADVNGYGASYVVSGAIQALALPFIFLARREKAVSDPISAGRRGDGTGHAPEAA